MATATASISSCLLRAVHPVHTINIPRSECCLSSARGALSGQGHEHAHDVPSAILRGGVIIRVSFASASQDLVHYYFHLQIMWANRIMDILFHVYQHCLPSHGR